MLQDVVGREEKPEIPGSVSNILIGHFVEHFDPISDVPYWYNCFWHTVLSYVTFNCLIFVWVNYLSDFLCDYALPIIVYPCVVVIFLLNCIHIAYLSPFCIIYIKYHTNTFSILRWNTLFAYFWRNWVVAYNRLCVVE